jgi:formylglycine-generating enzyme required for sulfatase activity
MIRRFSLALLLIAAPVTASATDVRVITLSAARRAGSASVSVSARVAWSNGWRNARNHDAVWLFVKLRGRSRSTWTHGRLAADPVASGDPSGACRVATDQVGAFCEPAGTHRGDVSWTVTLEVEPGSIAESDLASGAIEARVVAVEMVYVPAGPFSVGDPDPRSAENAAFYRSDPQGEHGGVFRVTSEDAIRVAPELGALYYRTPRPQYQGDRQGPVPAEFPKGTRAFYIMKYEILQGQYAEFLNTISREFTWFRSPLGGLEYAHQRGSIHASEGRYVAGRPDRPANWVSWDDGTAFADWAGLRPMTELEFTKAARGPVDPLPGDYPWGTTSKERLLRRVGPDDDLVQTGAASEAELREDTRDILGASYYWVMDLAGSVWEKVVSAGHPAGRAFRGSHGDGVLKRYGLATNEDWPSGDHDGGGYGYRGGGYYERGTADTQLNPFSRVSWRPYGAWGGAPRSIGYGFRAVRTADPVVSR